MSMMIIVTVMMERMNLALLLVPTVSFIAQMLDTGRSTFPLLELMMVFVVSEFSS